MPVGPQAGSKSWRLLGSKVVNRKGNLPELEFFGINMIESTRILLLDLVFEDADVFALRNLHSEHLILSITDNEAIEREQFRGVGYVDHSFRGVQTRKLATYQALLPECVDCHPKDHHPTKKISR